MAENLTTYTKIDPAPAALTVTASRVTYAAMPEFPDRLLYFDFGANHFDGDFIINLTMQRSFIIKGGILNFSLANDIDDYRTIDLANGSMLSVRMTCINSTDFRMTLIELDSGTQNGFGSFVGNVDTPYYTTFRRDEAVGTYGTLYLDIYSDVARTNLLEALSGALHSSKKDFQYLFAIQNSGSSNDGSSDGFVEDITTLTIIKAFVPKVQIF